MKKNNETGFNWIEITDSSLTNSYLWFNSKLDYSSIDNIKVDGIIVPTKENKTTTEFQLFEKVKELIKKAK